MRLEIKKMRLNNFRGFAHQEIEFDGNTKILGANAQGKTTLFFAWMWLMADKSDSLASNPSVTPMGMSECLSEVEAEITIDGQYCTLTKSQKFKEKIDDSGKTISKVDNKYTINGVEKTYHTFINDLKDRGIDMDNFLILSHVFAFTADTSKKGREEMRKVLFEMVDGITDLDIAKEMKSDDIIALLEKDYKIDEIEQMNKGSLKNLNARFGSNNELIDARIQGVIESKSQIDVKAAEQRKAEYEKELEEIMSKGKLLINEDNSIKQKIAELEGRCIEIESAERDKLYKQINEVVAKLQKAEEKASELRSDSIRIKCELDVVYEEREAIKESLENYRNLYKKVQDEYFDESSTVCPSCLRPFDKDKISEMKANFEEGKTKRLGDYRNKGETFAKKLAKLDEQYESINKKLNKADEEWRKVDKEVFALKEENESIPRNPNLSECAEYIETRKEIEELRNKLGQTDAEKIKELSDKEDSLIESINQTIGEIALAERNSELDKQIAELREDKKRAEIERSKHEKIINEVEKFKKAKNDKLSDMVNSHFHIAQFRLFKVLKNGSIEDDCSILVNGKELNSQLNQSTQILALTDVIAGLQDFKKQYLPVFLDNHALFTSESDSKIPLKCQVIKLIAAEGKEGLVIAHE